MLKIALGIAIKQSIALMNPAVKGNLVSFTYQGALFFGIMDRRNCWHKECSGDAVVTQQFTNARNALSWSELALRKGRNRAAAVPQFKRIMVGIKRQTNRTFGTFRPGRWLQAASGARTVHDRLQPFFRPCPCWNGCFGCHVVGPPLTDKVWPVIQLA
ncbi:hypothetical protein D3C81_1567660 [compost metagenome]